MSSLPLLHFAPAADQPLAFEFSKYPGPLRVAIIFGLSTALWALLIAGGWSLYALMA
jgi:hypothetical protein